MPRRFLFSVYRRRGDDLVHEYLEIVAADSFHAFTELPDDIVSWDFAQYQDGSYSKPILEVIQ